jgi:PAS domain S-box-containing protein
MPGKMPRLDTLISLRTKSALGIPRHQARSFAVLAITFIILLMMDLAACWGALEVVNSTRAYAVGEGRYSKAQKIAVLTLGRFINSRSQADYDAFLATAAVPQGDRDARVALQTTPFDRGAAVAGFLKGQNNADDVDSLIRLFRYFSWWKPFAAAVADWTEADRLVDSLVEIAGNIKSDNVSDAVTRASERAMVGHIDDQLTRREDAFSTHMSEAARGAKHVVVAGLGITTALLWTIGILFATRLFRRQLALDRQLSSSEQRFRDYAEVASDWYWEVDENRKITFLSELYFSLTGVNPDSILGKDATEFLRSYVADAESWARLAPFAAQRAIRGVRLRYPKADGTVIYLSVSAKPCFDEAGAFLGYRGVGSDVTSTFESAQTLRDAKERAEIANRAKSEFLANMSHELRTPLNAIIGFSEIIMNRVFGSANPERYDSYAMDINNSGKHLLSIIDEILDLSKIEAGREELAESEVDLDELIASTRRLFNGRFDQAELSLAIDTVSPALVLRADATKLKQCLSNLLSNALKFTPAGGKITVRAAFDDRGDLALSVSDTGIGIATTDIPTVMSPFGQVEAAFQRAHTGTGLGLPLTRALIELHGGAFRIDSGLGVGTTVTLTLPGHRIVSRARDAATAS